MKQNRNNTQQAQPKMLAARTSIWHLCTGDIPRAEGVGHLQRERQALQAGAPERWEKRFHGHIVGGWQCK